MKKVLSLLIIFIMTALSSQAKALKTTTIVQGAQLHFVVTSYNVTCNGTGFEGVKFETLSHDTKARVKVIKVTPDYLPTTLRDCPIEYNVLRESTITYSTNEQEMVILIMPDSMDVVIED